MHQAKVDMFYKILAPIDVSRLCVFLDLTNYYHRFIKNFSVIAKPLTSFTDNDQPRISDCE